MLMRPERGEAERLLELQDELDELEEELGFGRLVRRLPLVVAALWFGWIGTTLASATGLVAFLVSVPALLTLLGIPVVRHMRRVELREEIKRISERTVLAGPEQDSA